MSNDTVKYIYKRELMTKFDIKIKRKSNEKVCE